MVEFRGPSQGTKPRQAGTLGHALYRYRVRANLSTPAVTEAIGITTGLLSKYETNIRVPPLDKLARLATLYQLSPIERCELIELQGFPLGIMEFIAHGKHMAEMLRSIQAIGAGSLGNLTKPLMDDQTTGKVPKDQTGTKAT